MIVGIVQTPSGTPMPHCPLSRRHRVTHLLRATFAVLPALLLSACTTLSDLTGLFAPEGLIHRNHPLNGQLWDTRSARFVAPEVLLAEAAQTDIVLVGETHDNAEHHRVQARILNALLAAGQRPALAMEQFNRDQQDAVEQARKEKRLDRLGELAKGWEWPYYAPMVEQALTAGLPVVAANASRDTIRPVIRNGWAALAEGEHERLALEPSWTPERNAVMTQIIEQSHCGKIGPSLRDGLVRGQRVRDSLMADAVLAAGQARTLMIVGRGHARRDLGVPLYLATRVPAKSVLSIGLVEVSPQKTLVTDYLAATSNAEVGAVAHDYLWFTPRFARPDPCAQFGK